MGMTIASGTSMDLRYREATLEDLDACRALLNAAELYDAATRGRITAVWRQLRIAGSCKMAVLED